ncbi:MAG: hypothetical protein ABIH49_01480 [archaeon]
MGIKRKKKGVITDYLPWLIIAVAILVVLMFAIFVMKDKGISLIDKLKVLFRS